MAFLGWIEAHPTQPNDRVELAMESELTNVTRFILDQQLSCQDF